MLLEKGFRFEPVCDDDGNIVGPDLLAAAFLHYEEAIKMTEEEREWGKAIVKNHAAEIVEQPEDGAVAANAAGDGAAAPPAALDLNLAAVPTGNVQLFIAQLDDYARLVAGGRDVFKLQDGTFPSAFSLYTRGSRFALLRLAAFAYFATPFSSAAIERMAGVVENIVSRHRMSLTDAVRTARAHALARARALASACAHARGGRSASSCASWATTTPPCRASLRAMSWSACVTCARAARAGQSPRRRWRATTTRRRRAPWRTLSPTTS